MNEKVLELLKACLTAKEHGVDIWFDWMPHVEGITMYSYENRERDKGSDKPKRDLYITVYLDYPDANKQLTKAIKAVNKLVTKKGRK